MYTTIAYFEICKIVHDVLVHVSSLMKLQIAGKMYTILTRNIGTVALT